MLDSVAWVHDRLLEHLQVKHRLGRLAVHATCACSSSGSAVGWPRSAAAMADEVIVPAAGGCCGMAGDRGMLHPELPAAALRGTADELRGQPLDGAIASNRTCEIALQRETGLGYRSLVLTLEELTR